MIDEEDIDVIGLKLEGRGLSHSEIDTFFLEHYGVQGMRWGARRAANKASVAGLREKGLTKRQAKNTNRAQNRIDAIKMAATGRQGKVSALKQLSNRAIAKSTLSPGTSLRHPLSLKKASGLQLRKAEKTQAKIANGEKKITAALARLGGLSVKDLDYSI